MSFKRSAKSWARYSALMFAAFIFNLIIRNRLCAAIFLCTSVLGFVFALIKRKSPQ